MDNEQDKMKEIVVIGGGEGTKTVLSAFKDATAIVGVTDNGRSTGRIRRMFNIPAVGDIRNCFSAYGDEMGELFNERFRIEELHGIALGNLVIAVLAENYGFEAAIEKLNRIFKSRIIPVSLGNTHICAELSDGLIVQGETNVRALNKSSIKRVFLREETIANQKAIDAIEKADFIIFGPGSLYVSVMSCLLFKGITAAINGSKAKKIFICNTTVQPGQTDNYKVIDHIRKIKEYANIDYVLVNGKEIGKDVSEKLEKEGIKQILPDEEYGPDVIVADLIEESSEKQLYDKQDTIRHDPKKLYIEINKIMDIQPK